MLIVTPLPLSADCQYLDSISSKAQYVGIMSINAACHLKGMNAAASNGDNNNNIPCERAIENSVVFIQHSGHIEISFCVGSRLTFSMRIFHSHNCCSHLNNWYIFCVR